ncbi:uncharacterized protein LOC133840214 isoform X1 [Drosophila sulfurigaster albostrigata]|uniref:uncharacterized protein LOC133840214 isoform X1 n=1 Tax=Drosophila sulfurigaster albostrigata TaxID=89887 RepID=UPI002D21A98C|nr:uncharacterized protein LOC133840214 isoform X1 [Drosophila sulfurigaster albostrigata]
MCIIHKRGNILLECCLPACLCHELSSFMSSPSDYGLNHNDFDDIISSTVSHLDPGLDLNSIIPDNPENSLQGENLFSDLFQSATVGANDLELNFNSFSAFETPNLTTDDSSFSTSVAENPNDLLNICNDNAEIEKLTFGNLLAHSQNRDTPSPTESWGSSSGSSTSGVQSDASDAWQQHKQQYDQVDIESCQQSAPPQTLVQFVQGFRAQSNDSISDSTQTLPQNTVAQSVTNQQQPIKVPIPKLIVPTATVAAVPPPKVETKIQKAPDKLQATDSPGESLGKTKTIFLSPNDYKALMQKMNLHGTKGAKINGSVKPQIPKIVVKTGNDKVQCQQNSVRTASSNNPNNPLKISTSARVGSIIDEKMYKKQQRMIKNRESASLSRKKKKEYVVSLEARINHLEKQNSTLKGENVTLRNQLVAFAKTCKCRKGSACEFVLHSLNTASRGEQHVKIAPRPTATSFRQHMNAATVKKNVAVLFAMAFMVTLNAGNFHSYLSKQNLDPESVATVADATPNVNEPIPIGRRLLWVDSEEEYNEKLNRSSRQAAEELVMPPLHFLRPASRAQNATAKSDDWNSTDTGRHNKSGAPPPLTYPSPSHSNCSMNSAGGNQTEYSRLSLNLQKLINVSGYLNLSKHASYDIEQDNEHGYKFATDYLDLPDLEQQRTQLGKRKTFVGFNERLTDIEHKQRKMDTLNTQRSDNKTNDSINLFKGIKRQDDTFYVLSFNTQHILVSPSTRDKSARPKISLLLPTAEPSHNGDMMMMQVDCEVFNTKELEIKSDMIPAKLRPNVTKWQMKPKHIALNNNIGINKTQGSIKLQDKIVQPEKPRVRTYFMVGPKNQAAAAASQEKPRFVEYNSSRTLNSDTFDSRLHG